MKFFQLRKYNCKHNCICVGAWDGLGKDKLDYYYEFTKKSMINYSQKHNFDFIELNSNIPWNITESPKNSHINKGTLIKYYLKDFLLQYDNVIFLDADILIVNDSINILDYCLDDHLNVTYPTYMIGKKLDEGIDRIIQYYDLNFIFDWNKYFSAGMMVLNRNCFSLFSGAEDIRNIELHLFEQSMFNFNLQFYNIPVNFIDNSFNFIIDNNNMKCPQIEKRSKKSRKIKFEVFSHDMIEKLNIKFIHFAGSNKFNTIKKFMETYENYTKKC